LTFKNRHLKSKNCNIADFLAKRIKDGKPKFHQRHTSQRCCGVAMGKEDAIGSDKEFNTGRTAGICYDHKRTTYAMEDKYEKKN